MGEPVLESNTAPFGSWFTIFVSFTSWITLYYYTQLKFRDKSPEYCSRFLTVLHGTVTAWFGITQCCLEVPLWKIPNEPTTCSQGFFLAVSLGYFLMDLAWCCYFQTESALIIGHHVYSCVALTRMLFRGTYGHQATCTLGVLEITNPLLQARWFLRTYGYVNTPLFYCVEITFIVLFLLARLGFGSVAVLNTIIRPSIPLELKLLAILIYCLSWIFAINICKYFAHKYIESRSSVDLQPNISLIVSTSVENVK